LIAKEIKMKAKITLPYILSGAMLMSSISTSKTSAMVVEPTAKKKVCMFAPFYSNEPSTITIPNEEESSRAVKVIDRNKHLLYICENGDTICRSNGTRAWRNNNPGNLVYGDFARENGAIGKGGKFAAFPDEATGRTALAELLRGEKYCNLTIDRAIIKYAPPRENNVALYKKQLRDMTGLPLNIKISQLTPEQMESVVDAICVIEGWKPGQEKTLVASSRQKAADAKRNATTLAMAVQHAMKNQRTL